MTDPGTLRTLQSALVGRAGGYLRNPVRLDGVTCSVCTTPVTPGFAICRPCQNHRLVPGHADLVAPLTYAIAGRQSGYVMRGYKATPPVPEHHTVVSLLCIVGMGLHAYCADKIAGVRVTHWTIVPSLARTGEHPLHRIVALPKDREVPLAARSNIAIARSVNAHHFQAATRLPPGSHVLLLDDTWVSGGHAQSATLALRRAGAARVSVLVLARWLDENFGNNAAFVRQRLTADFDPTICPWTGTSCP